MKALRRFFRSDFAICILVYVLFFLVFFRANWAFEIRRLSDENSYLSWLDLIGIPFFSPDPLSIPYKKIFHSPGPAVFWLPADFLARLTSLLLPFDPARWRWSVVALFSSSFWIVGFYFGLRFSEVLGFIRRRGAGEVRSTRDVLFVFALMACTQGAAFAFFRPLMAHTVEIALVFASVYLAWRERWGWAFACAVLLVITRYNDLPIFLLLVGRYLDRRGTTASPLRAIPAWLKWTTLVPSVLVLAWVFYVGFVKGYGGYTFPDLFLTFSVWDFYRFFFSMDWGLVFLLPVWWLAAVYAGAGFRRYSYAAKGAFVWMVAEAAIYILWGSNGGSFGLRYLIGSFVGVMVIWAEAIRLNPATESFFRKIVVGNGVWILFLTFVFWSVEPDSLVGNPMFLLEAFTFPFAPTFLESTFGHSPIALSYLFLTRGGAPGTVYFENDNYLFTYENGVAILGATLLAFGYLGLFAYFRIRDSEK